MDGYINNSFQACGELWSEHSTPYSVTTDQMEPYTVPLVQDKTLRIQSTLGNFVLTLVLHHRQYSTVNAF